MDKKQRCRECKFWKAHNMIHFGTCRRYPPDAKSQQMPVTTFSVWCGEWKRNRKWDIWYIFLRRVI